MHFEGIDNTGQDRSKMMGKFMKYYQYYVVDVFTDTAFCGNPLAVLPEAEGLSDEEMQRIAGEFNLSETVFVFESTMALRKLRIFTPNEELPLAGHPVVGAWKVLADIGVVTPENQVIEQELNVGILPVELEFGGIECSSVKMKQANFERHHTLEKSEADEVAKALGLTLSSIGNSSISSCDVISTGVPSLSVPVHSLKTLADINVKTDALAAISKRYGTSGVYVYCFETKNTQNAVSARFFAPSLGIVEDAATGSAAGALGANLVSRGALEAGSDSPSNKGIFMGRPSRISVSIEGFDDLVTAVYVAGSAVEVMRGDLRF